MYEVIGIEKVDYISKKTNKQVKGYTLHLCYEKENCDGLAVVNEFVGEEYGKDIKVNDKIELFYNKYGKINKIDIV